MKQDDYFAIKSRKPRALFGTGNHSSLLDAFALCVMNKLPLPDWRRRPIACKLETDFANARSGEGKRGRTRRQACRSRYVPYPTIVRWSWARDWLANKKELKAFGYKPARERGI